MLKRVFMTSLVLLVLAAVAFSTVLKSNGEIWGCGWNQYGQLGLGNTQDRNALTKVGST